MYDDRPLKPLQVRRVIATILRDIDYARLADQVEAIRMRHKIKRLQRQEYNRRRSSAPSTSSTAPPASIPTAVSGSRGLTVINLRQKPLS